MNLSDLKWPRMIESDPALGRVIDFLDGRMRPIGSGGRLVVPVLPFFDALADALASANRRGQLVRGLEGAARILEREREGLDRAGAGGGSMQGLRISRLLLVTTDASGRFYRALESLVERHGPRVFAAAVDTDAQSLGRVLFERGRLCRLVMVAHKEALADVIMSLSRATRDDPMHRGPVPRG